MACCDEERPHRIIRWSCPSRFSEKSSRSLSQSRVFKATGSELLTSLSTHFTLRRSCYARPWSGLIKQGRLMGVSACGSGCEVIVPIVHDLHAVSYTLVLLTTNIAD